MRTPTISPSAKRIVISWESYTGGRAAGRRRGFPRNEPLPPPVPLKALLEMAREKLVHLEHRHFLFAEDGFELVVGQDLAPVLRILQIVLLDVNPELADGFGPRQGLVADNLRQFFRGLQRLHQAGIALCGGAASRGFLCRGLGAALRSRALAF